MLKFESPVVLQLADGQLLRWCGSGGTQLSVQGGRVWVTQSDDAEDHFLDPGARMRLRPRAQVLIGAEGPAQLAFEAEAGALRRALGRWLQRASSSRARRGSIAGSVCPATGAVSSIT